MLGTLLFLGAVGISGICCSVDNYKTKKDTTKIDKNGNITYYDRNGQDYINHEKVYRRTQYGEYNQEHHQIVGVRSGIVYDDDYDRMTKLDRETSERNKRESMARGKLTYDNYDPRFRRKVTTEIGTGKVIACLYKGENLKTGEPEYRKFYVKDNPGKTDYYKTVPGDFGIIITEEEYDKIQKFGSYSTIPTDFNVVQKLLGME